MSRYIDKEKLERFFNRYEWGTCDERWMPESEFGKFVDAIPTADVAEVKHGKWLISEYDYYDCSVCGESYFNGCDSTSEAKRRLEIHQDVYDYCPYCGAKMDGGELCSTN